MSSVIVCDKCGFSDKDVTKFMHIRAHKLIDTETFKKYAENHIDVCKDCYESIFKEVNEND